MAQLRVFYACEQACVAPCGTNNLNSSHVLHGVQSVGMKSDFRLEAISELGQLEIYENVEQIPNLEITFEKVLDGYPLVYHHLTRNGSTSTSLAGRSNAVAMGVFTIFNDQQDSASGTALAYVVMSGIYTSSLSYKFPVQGNFTESVTAVGNHRQWSFVGATGQSMSTGFFDGTFFTMPDTPLASTGSGGVNRREDLLFDYTTVNGWDSNGLPIFNNGCTLPRDVDGINSSGQNITNSDGKLNSILQDITVSSNFGRDEIFQLGKRLPYFRYVKFPVEVTCEIQTLAKGADNISHTENGIYSNGDNTRHESIRIVTREGTRLDLGVKNRLSSFTTGGGDTGGANLSYSYTYTNNNALKVIHVQDPNTTFRGASF